MRRITWVLLAFAAGCDTGPGTPEVNVTVGFHILSTGTGRILSSQGIHCPGDCVAGLDQGSTISLAVFPDANSVFVSWTGDCTGAEFVQIKVDADIDCAVRLNLKPGGVVLTGRGTLAFDHRIEAALLRNGLLWTAGFDLAQGNIVDISNPDNPTSGVGPEFISCLGAGGLSFFFSPLPQYRQDVVHATCEAGRAGTLSPTGAGLDQSESYGYGPGEAEPVPGTRLEAIADFEFGQLRLVDRDTVPGSDVIIPLSNPLERSCPFDLAIAGTVGYVVGREGTIGTATANCENWHGLWRVDLDANEVIGFTPFGAKLRDAIYFEGFVYVADFEQDKIHVVDAGTGTVDLSFDVGDGPIGLAIEDRLIGHDLLYVTLGNANRISVVDLVTKLELGGAPSGGVAPVKAFRDGSTLMVLNSGDAGNNIGAVIKVFTVE